MGDFLGGVLLGVTLLLLAAGIWAKTLTPEITNEDFYRFCMMKEISLEECVIPAWPANKREKTND